jgi:hypothetical protein
MGAEESLINAVGESVGRKVPVLGISSGAAETAKEAWDAKNAFARAGSRNRSKQERIAATRAATIYSRRAVLKAASTVARQVPVYGTAAALALDGVNALLNVADGAPRERKEGASRSGMKKKRSTEGFMRTMREQAESADRGLRNGEAQFSSMLNSKSKL